VPQQSEKKVGWTAVRVPLLIVLALLAMLAIGVLIYNRA
jgi:hypothetical protein